MSKFKVGDKVKRIGPSWSDCVHGEIYKVKSIESCGTLTELLELEGLGCIYSSRCFELYVEESKPKPTNPRHKHADIIHAYAEGFDIEFRTGAVGWSLTTTPSFCTTYEYRVKPQPPKKTEQELQIEKLEETVKLAQSTVKDALSQIEVLKGGK